MITLEEAIVFLQQGQVVALPTETVYGLAARYDSPQAIENLYHLKGRPKHKALTVNLYSAEQIRPFLLHEPKGLNELMQAYWPGPLTLVVDIREHMILPDVRSRGGSCGFRVPDHPLTRAVIRAVGPIVLPSANLSGKPAAKSAQEIELSSSVPILDGGACILGIESTVLAYKKGGWVILREGAISKNSLQHILSHQSIT
jgi:L-threonylcarbamoyladenylate synthase